MADETLLPCFFYGTLMFDDVYLRVVSQGSEKVTQAPLSKPAILKSHKRCSIRDRQYPALVSVPSEPEAKVEGVIRFVPESHVVWLDDWEEVEYEKRTVTVEIHGSGPVSATTYVWIVEGTNELLPQDWDPKKFETEDLPGWLANADAPGGQLGWFGFPEEGRDGSKVGQADES